MKKQGGKANVRWLKPAAGIFVMLLLVLYQTGFFQRNSIDPGRNDISPPVPGGAVFKISRVIEVPRIFEESGIVSTSQKAELSSMIMGVIKEITVNPGDVAEAGQVLLRIDSGPFRAKLAQAESGKKQAEAARAQAVQQLSGAQAAYDQADSNYRRIRSLYEKKAAPKVKYEEAESGFKQASAMLNLAKEGISAAEAEVARAEKIVKEAAISLSYTEITAPFKGKITKKLCDPGDLAVQGRPLLYINNESSMLLEAQLSEKFKDSVRLGMQLELDVAGRTYAGRIAEIIPSVDPATRTFTVKASFEPSGSVFVGTYGKILVPSGYEKIVIVPDQAVTRIGQLFTVTVKKEGRLIRKYVRTGKYKKDGFTEILAGLSGGEEVLVSRSGS